MNNENKILEDPAWVWDIFFLYLSKPDNCAMPSHTGIKKNQSNTLSSLIGVTYGKFNQNFSNFLDNDKI